MGVRHFYAKERLQMRALTGAKAKDLPADPIIVHPDVRRMLLTQKSLVEGGERKRQRLYVVSVVRKKVSTFRKKYENL